MALGVGIAVLWALRRWLGPPDDRWYPWAALLTVARAGIVSAWVFYLWSPLLFANQHRRAGLAARLPRPAHRRARASRPSSSGASSAGWTISSPTAGMRLLWPLVLINLACVVWRPRRPLTFAVFAAASLPGLWRARRWPASTPSSGKPASSSRDAISCPPSSGCWRSRCRTASPRRVYALLAGVIVVNLLLMQRHRDALLRGRLDRLHRGPSVLARAVTSGHEPRRAAGPIDRRSLASRLHPAGHIVRQRRSTEPGQSAHGRRCRRAAAAR